jgi:hypothetical protein
MNETEPTVQYVPAGHSEPVTLSMGVGTVDPPKQANPGLQRPDEDTAWPVPLQNDPAAHLRQAVMLAPPTTGLYVPAGHKAGDADPETQYDPVGQMAP